MAGKKEKNAGLRLWKCRPGIEPGFPDLQSDFIPLE